MMLIVGAKRGRATTRFATTLSAAVLAACLMTVPAAAKSKKLRSIDALAQALAARIPQKPGTVVYVAFPSWKGKEKHFLLRKEIGKELTAAFAAALPDDKIYTPDDAAKILAKTGIQPLDLYFDFPLGQYGGHLVAMMGATLTIASLIAEDANGIRLTVSVWKVPENERLAEKSAVVAEAPRIRELLSLPDKPAKDSAGVYEAGIGGVVSPRCIRCTKPAYPPVSMGWAETGTIFLRLTVEMGGSVADVAVLGIEAKRSGALLAKSAVRAVRAWHMAPALGPDKKPVPARILVEIQFTLGS